MTARMRPYQPETDFIRIRDFLNETYCRFPWTCNWGMERWNYARYFLRRCSDPTERIKELPKEA